MKTVEEMYNDYKSNVMGDREYPPVLLTLSRISFDAGVMMFLKELNELEKNNDQEDVKKFIEQIMNECSSHAEHSANDILRRN